MIISEERQSHLARLLVDSLWGEEVIDFDEDIEDVIIRHTKMALSQWVEEQGDMDQQIRHKISAIQRGVAEGTPEWSVLYKKYMQEEMSRRGHR